MPLKVGMRGNRFLRMGSRGALFATRVPPFEQEAASQATKTSRMVFSNFHSSRPLAPPRPGRPTTEGAFSTLLRWERTGKGAVVFDRTILDARAPYWVIQEIGSGQSARILNPPGEVAVPSQVGRRLPGILFWADSPASGATAATGLTKRAVPFAFGNLSNRASRPGDVAQRSANASGAGTSLHLIGQQQLYLRPPGSMLRSPGRIRRNIVGKHFVRDGGIEGMQVLRDALAGEFRQLRGF